ncbi:Spermidine synthase [Actinomycetales bacterium JB111]|nr:Spermidine synthase [Actinomycetales bacterium JB111]
MPTTFSVAEVQPERGAPHRVMLLLGGSESSFLDLDDPAYLEFEYMQHMRAVIEALFPPGGPVASRFVHLGAAACALPRALIADRPTSRHLAVELDTELSRLVRAWFDLPRSPSLRIRNDEARSVTRGLRPGSADVVVRDVFIDAEVPEHLRTREFVAEVAAVLDDAGVYLVNLTDSPGLARTRQEVAALSTAFAHVVAVTDPAIWKGKRYGNVVLAASRRPVDTATIDVACRRLPFPAKVVPTAELARLAGSTRAPEDPPEDPPDAA